MPWLLPAAGHVHTAREDQCGSCLGLPPDPLAAPLVAFPCETQVGPGPHGRVSHRELVLFGFKYQETLCKTKQTWSGCIPPSQGLSSVKLQSESTLQSCLDSSLLGSAPPVLPHSTFEALLLPAWLPVDAAVSFELSEYEDKPPALFCVPSEETVGRGKGLCQSPAFRPHRKSAPGSPSLWGILCPCL